MTSTPAADMTIPSWKAPACHLAAPTKEFCILYHSILLAALELTARSTMQTMLSVQTCAAVASRTFALIKPEEVLHFRRSCAPVLAAAVAVFVISISMLRGTDILVSMLERLCFEFGVKNLSGVDAAYAKLAHDVLTVLF